MFTLAKKFFREEKGNIIMIFAAAMVLIIFFLGIALDVSMLYMEYNSMQNLLQVIRDERFTYQDTIRYAENPALETYKIVRDSVEKNGFDGQVKVYFYEKTPDESYREYTIRVQLSDTKPYYFGRIFGLTTKDLTVYLDGREIYGEGGADRVWHPTQSVSFYNGSYTGGAGVVVPSYDGSDLPSGW